MAALVKYLFFSVFFCLCGNLNAEVLCDRGFCTKYQYEVGCSPPWHHCSTNNATHSGVSLPSPTTCNCCDYCLPFIVENDHCSLGGAGDGVTVGRCGPGLTCVPEEEENFCRRIPADQSKCHSAQDEYDLKQATGEAGSLELRPVCDGKGNFAPFACVPTQTCFCQSEEGERLFGEVLYQGSTPNMRCECSRINDKIRKLISSGVRFPVVGPRCTSDGNFNPIQCINRDCYCVNINTGEILGGSHINLDEKPISELKCYNKELDLFSRFQLSTPPFNYTSPCLDDMRQRTTLILDSEIHGYNVDYFSEVNDCLPDGTYGRVAKDINNVKHCVDEWGMDLGNYTAEPGTTAYDDMNCKCAVTSQVMSSSLEKPVCCKNGNFRSIQCRRGLCRCVDEDGRQRGKETVDVASLSCYTGSQWLNC